MAKEETGVGLEGGGGMGCEWGTSPQWMGERLVYINYMTFLIHYD